MGVRLEGPELKRVDSERSDLRSSGVRAQSRFRQAESRFYFGRLPNHRWLPENGARDHG